MIILLILPVAACNGRATGAPPTAAPTAAIPALTVEPGTMPEPDPLSARGDIVTAGSSTVYPLSERVAERYIKEGYPGQITIDSIGTGAGFERFCVAGETDIVNASRPIKDGEVEACRAAGRDPVEFRVGTDALAVVVNRANDFVDDLTVAQLALAFGPATTWAEVDPGFPDAPIRRYSSGTDSGTFDFLVETLFDADTRPILSAANIQFSEDDNVLAQGVAGDPYAIGYFGYAYYLENADRLKIISVEGVEPTAQSAEDGRYPLSRPLFLYSAASIMQARPQVADFINFYLTNVNDEILGVGYFPAGEAALQVARDNWLAALGGPTAGRPGVRIDE